MLWSRAGRVLDASRHRDLTYPEVGATGRSRLPDGYHHVSSSRVVGHGAEAFAAASAAVLRWRMHRDAGLRVAATADEASAGTVGSLADKVVLYCFAYDTASGHYKPTMRALAVVAAPFVFLLGFLVYRTVRRDPTPPAPPLGSGLANSVDEDRRP